MSEQQSEEFTDNPMNASDQASPEIMQHPESLKDAVVSKNDLSFASSFHHHYDPIKKTSDRRGSDFLLLAAEAMERTESRRDAIRRAAARIDPSRDAVRRKSKSDGDRPPPQRHVYHDYASSSLSSEAAAGDTPLTSRKKTGGVSQPFPEKLMLLLDRESGRRPDVVSWLPHGRAFLVGKPKAFTGEIMPEYFRQSKLTSFQRQLNLYGFRRITQGTDGGAYYHELFLRGRPNLCATMVRQKVKGTGHKQPTDVASEPNFYSMPPVSAEDASSNTDRATLPKSSSSLSLDRATPTEEEERIYNRLMSSPGFHAAALLKRLSWVGTPSQFSLNGDILPPPVFPDIESPSGEFRTSGSRGSDSIRGANSEAASVLSSTVMRMEIGGNHGTHVTDADAEIFENGGVQVTGEACVTEV